MQVPVASRRDVATRMNHSRGSHEYADNLRCGRSHLAEESGTRALLNRGHRRRGLLSLRRRVSSSRVRLVVLSSGGSSRSCGSDSRSAGSAARRGRRRGGTTALTRHFGCVFSLEKK